MLVKEFPPAGVAALSARSTHPLAQPIAWITDAIERFEPPITAERIRLRIVQAHAIPSISSMTVYGR